MDQTDRSSVEVRSCAPRDQTEQHASRHHALSGTRVHVFKVPEDAARLCPFF